MEIPYTLERREDTGRYNGQLGMWLFLASEVMLFAALFASYVLLRFSSSDWPDGASRLDPMLEAMYKDPPSTFDKYPVVYEIVDSQV